MAVRIDTKRELLLLENARNDLNAFKELYQLYLPNVYAYVSYKVGRVQDTDDLVSSIFLKAIEHLDHFHWQGEGSFTAWLFRVAHDKVIDYYRANQNDHRVISLEELPDLANSELLPNDRLVQKEQLALLRQLINSLPSRQQEIITLRFFGALRNSEIAGLLGLDERTVASHLCRGMEKLHRLYQETSFQKESEEKDD